MPWNVLLILWIVSAALCAVGFYKFVYFLSIGYGFAVAGCGITVCILYFLSPTATPAWIVLLQAALFLAYGIRLSGFLLIRELKDAAFRKSDVAKASLARNTDKKMPVFVLAAIWICVSALYVAQVSPMLFRELNGASDVVVPLVGAAISVFGIVLEAAADHQKSVQKKARPDMVATEGLYRIVRCPNYLGEILFWTGVLVGGVSAYANAGQWIMAIVAYVCIVYIMFNGAQRMEKRQMSRYGASDEYNAYADRTPILIPLLPIYHLNKKP